MMPSSQTPGARLSRALRSAGVRIVPVAFLAAAGACAPTIEAQHFASYEARMISEGELRTDRAPADAPFTNEDLVVNFERVTFHLEEELNPGRGDLHQVQRWEEPIRWWLRAEPAEAGAIRADIEATFDRLARVTGLDIAEAENDRVSNIDIIVPVAETYEIHEAWAKAIVGPRFAERLARFRTQSYPCAVTVSVREEDDAKGPRGSVSYAFVMIRGGFTPSYRLGCVEEELAQTVGPSNDDDRVRPSIFNDDEEFALLTVHDEYLLRALYDPRLAAGMPKEDALELLPEIFEDLRPGG